MYFKHLNNNTKKALMVKTALVLYRLQKKGTEWVTNYNVMVHITVGVGVEGGGVEVEGGEVGVEEGGVAD